MEYAGAVWDSWSKADAVHLKHLQVSLARAIIGTRRTTVTKSFVLETLSWATLAWHRRRQQTLLIWKLQHGDGPPSLQERLPTDVKLG